MPTLQCLLFVSPVNIEKPCSLHEQLLGGLFLPATHAPTSGPMGPGPGSVPGFQQ